MADARAPLSVEEVLGAPTVAAYSPPALSSDNRLVAYVVTDSARRRQRFERNELRSAGVAWFGIASDIWITDLETGEHENVTAGSGHSWGPAWSPDGEHLAFLSDRSGGHALGPARVWVWDRASATLRQASTADVRETLSGLQWAGDRHVVVSLFPEDLGRDGFTARLTGDTACDGSREGVTAKVFAFDPSGSESEPSTDQINLDIWRQDVGLIDCTSGALRRLTRGERIGHQVVSPDQAKVAYSALRRGDAPGSGRYRYDIVVLDIASDGGSVVASDVLLPIFATTFSWSPASDAVAWRSGGPGVDDDVHVARLDGGAPQRVADAPSVNELTTMVEPPVWDLSGQHVYFVREHALWRAAVDGTGAALLAKSDHQHLRVIAPRQGRVVASEGDGWVAVSSFDPSTKRVGFCRVDVSSGEITPAVEEDKRYGGYGTEPTISPDGTTIAYIAEDRSQPADVYVTDARLTGSRRVSEVAPAFRQRVPGDAEVISWRGLDGEVHRGALVYPAGYQPGTSYPLIVKIYGGSPVSDYLNSFGNANAAVENVQLFATRGYAVLLADSKLNVGTPMLDLAKTIIPGINAVVAMGVADPERIGVTGHSYGGYSTLALIAQSPRFRAAVMRAGMGDLIGGYGQLAPDGTNYGLAWAESGQARMGGHPWEFRDRYIENSPIFYLDRVETPLLIVHGSEDDAVPVFLADQVFTGLRRLGKSVTYARYEGEDHWEGNWSYDNQVDVLDRVIAWFDQHLTA